VPKTILVVVDPVSTDPQPVVERAAWLAEKAGAAVELFACDYDADIDAGRVASVWIPDAGAREHVLLEHRRRIEGLAEPLRARGLTVTVDVRWDFPLGEAVLDKVLDSAPWLVAKGTSHHNVLQRTLLSNTDWFLIRNCPAPLWLVKPRPAETTGAVLAAVDPLHQHAKPAQLDDVIIRFASVIAKASDAPLRVVHAFAVPMGLELPPDATGLVAREHREALAAFAAKHGLAEVDVRLVEGFAHDVLLRVAREEYAGFVVMGVIARRGFDRLFIGSTAERVLDRLPCDLFIVKPAGFKPPAEYVRGA
jgi:universal stress protein E